MSSTTTAWLGPFSARRAWRALALSTASCVGGGLAPSCGATDDSGAVRTDTCAAVYAAAFAGMDGTGSRAQNGTGRVGAAIPGIPNRKLLATGAASSRPN